MIGFGQLAFAITILTGGIWSALRVINLHSGPASTLVRSCDGISAVAGVELSRRKGVAAHFCSAAPLPEGQQKIRTDHLWALGAGVLSVVAVAGIWIVLFRLVKMPPHVLSDVSSYPQNDGSTHDLEWGRWFLLYGGGWLSRIFPGRSPNASSSPHSLS